MTTEEREVPETEKSLVLNTLTVDDAEFKVGLSEDIPALEKRLAAARKEATMAKRYFRKLRDREGFLKATSAMKTWKVGMTLGRKVDETKVAEKIGKLAEKIADKAEVARKLMAAMGLTIEDLTGTDDES